jgi:CIC family chloride channel protein
LAGPSPARSKNYEDRLLLVLTLIIGAVVGLVVVGFILLTERLGARMYPAGSPVWHRVLVPIAGAVGTGFLLFRYFPNARGSGIPQTKTAMFIRDGVITLRTVIGKFSLCSISLASGIALGREGPSVHVGAGIASMLGRRLGLSANSVKALVPAGASAALAAAFNTPISAVLFTLEEVMGDMHAPVLGSIVLSSATSWMVLHLLLGDEPLFHVPAYELVHPLEFAIYAVLGLVGGLVSVAFVKLLLWQRKYFLAMPEYTQWILPGVGGLTVGLLGWFYPQVLGVGYSYVGQALNGQMLVGTMALLTWMKLLATATCYSSGNAGGIFGPALFIGAMMGGAVGGTAHRLIPDITGNAGAYALVGMGAAFAGIVRVPLTSVIMIFEITRDYSIIVPLMISNLISYFISSQLQEEPIYEGLLHQDGIHLPMGARAREALLTVGHAFRSDAQVLSATLTVSQALSSVERGRGPWPVVDNNGLRGMIDEEKLKSAAADGKRAEPLGHLVPEPLSTEELTSEAFPHVHADHPLDTAMRRIAQSGLKAIPVVSRTNVRDLKGTISLEDILSAYETGAVERPPATPVPQPSRPRLAPLFVVLSVLTILILLGGFLNYFYRLQRAGRAQRFYKEGITLMAQDRYEEAVEQFRHALSASHTPQHRLALAEALAKGRHANEASLYFDEVLREEPDNGAAHLGLARLESDQHNVNDAVANYRAAIYGRWPEHAEQHRIQARIELVQLLASSGHTSQARTELLSLAAEIPKDPALHKQVAALLDNIGDAELAAGDYSSARQTFNSVLRVEPSDQNAAKRLELTEEVLALDPRLPVLSPSERLARSRLILNAVRREAGKCPAARVRVKRPVTYEKNLEAAVSIWQSCVQNPAPDDPLARVMALLK